MHLIYIDLCVYMYKVKNISFSSVKFKWKSHG